MNDQRDSDVIRKALQAKLPLLVNSLGMGKYKIRRKELRFGRKGSFVVSTNPGSIGLWYNFEDGTGGDIFDLIMLQNEMDFLLAKNWAVQWLGSHGTRLEGFSND